MDELSEGVLEVDLPDSPDRDHCGEAETTVTLLQCDGLHRTSVVIARPSQSVRLLTIIC
jgi:hypothetical protein